MTTRKPNWRKGYARQQCVYERSWAMVEIRTKLETPP